MQKSFFGMVVGALSVVLVGCAEMTTLSPSLLQALQQAQQRAQQQQAQQQNQPARQNAQPAPTDWSGGNSNRQQTYNQNAQAYNAPQVAQSQGPAPGSQVARMADFGQKEQARGAGLTALQQSMVPSGQAGNAPPRVMSQADVWTAFKDGAVGAITNAKAYIAECRNDLQTCYEIAALPFAVGAIANSSEKAAVQTVFNTAKSRYNGKILIIIAKKNKHTIEMAILKGYIIPI